MAELTRRQRVLGTRDLNLWFWVFVGPFFLGLLTFVYVPIVWSVWLSFYDARNTPTTFVGFGNYADTLADPAFPVQHADLPRLPVPSVLPRVPA